jgi:peptide/nickel transport system substrate-binding protein
MKSSPRIGCIRFAIAGLAVLACAGLAACGSSTNSAGGGGAPQRGGIVSIARPSEVDSVDPGLLTTDEDYNTDEALYDALLRPTADGQSLAPGLASSYDFDKKSLTYTFHLRPKLSFSTGAPLTSKDMKFSILYAEKGSTYGALLSAVKSVSAPDPNTVVVKLSHYDNLFLPGLAFAFALPDNFEGKSKSAFFKRPTSSGPFKIRAWSPGRQLTLVKSGAFWDAANTYPDGLNIRIITDATARINAIKTNQAQLNEYVPTSQAAQLQPDQLVGVDPSARNVMLATNNAKAPFDKVAVREAASLAIDRPLLLKTVWGGHGAPVQGIIPPGVPNSQSHTSGATTWEYNPAKARELLARAGTPHPSFTLLVAYEAGIDATLTSALQSELQSVGFHVSVHVTDFATAVNQSLAGEFQVFLVPNASYLPTAGEAMTFYASTFATIGRWNVKEAETYVARFRTASTDSARDAAVTAFESWNKRLVNIIPVGEPELFVAKSASLTGLKMSPFYTYRSEPLALSK